MSLPLWLDKGVELTLALERAKVAAGWFSDDWDREPASPVDQLFRGFAPGSQVLAKVWKVKVVKRVTIGNS